MKYRLTKTSVAPCSPDWDQVILKPTGETENGRPVYANNGTGVPYLWWSGAGYDPEDSPPYYYCVTDDGSRGFDFSGTYIVDVDTVPNPPDENSCLVYKRTTGSAAYLRTTPLMIPCGARPWVLIGGSVTLLSEANGTSDGRPYEGHYGTAPHADPPWVWRIERNIPAGQWVLSVYPTMADLIAATGEVNNHCDGPAASDPSGSFNAALCSGLCDYSLAEYHYPSPSCYYVRTDPDDPPSIDYTGQYLFTNTYSPDDDDDRGVFQKEEGKLLYYHAGRWRIGSEIETDGDFQSWETTKRTPAKGLYFPVDPYGYEYILGQHKVALCGGGRPYPWCCKACLGETCGGCRARAAPRNVWITFSGMTGSYSTAMGTSGSFSEFAGDYKCTPGQPAAAGWPDDLYCTWHASLKYQDVPGHLEYFWEAFVLKGKPDVTPYGLVAGIAHWADGGKYGGSLGLLYVLFSADLTSFLRDPWDCYFDNFSSQGSFGGTMGPGPVYCTSAPCGGTVALHLLNPT